MILKVTIVAVLMAKFQPRQKQEWRQIEHSLCPLKCNINIYEYIHMFIQTAVFTLKLPRILISLLISRAVSPLWHIRPCSLFSLL
jgi:hypothetical protein